MRAPHSEDRSPFDLPPLSALERAAGREILEEKTFQQRLLLEQRRTERSRNRFVLMILDLGNLPRATDPSVRREQFLERLLGSIRETDFVGRYSDETTIGVLFTEIGDADGKAVANSLLNRVTSALVATLGIERIHQVAISFHVFPADWNEDQDELQPSLALYPEPAAESLSHRAALAIKRLMDIAGSLAAIALFSPLMIGLALAVKFTSPGPILFRQKRVGQYGRWFTFLKFRSMHIHTDPKVHQEFMKQFIEGSAGGNGDASGKKPVYKLQRDPRLTSIGSFIRRTSLDELPQFLNVLKGDMSLVGPRPPIPYEVDRYDVWHRRRLLPVKPGITGLWQVNGRSRVGFDEMVRLDLQYARTWSLWLDVKILLQTPGAVIGGDGAF